MKAKTKKPASTLSSTVARKRKPIKLSRSTLRDLASSARRDQAVKGGGPRSAVGC